MGRCRSALHRALAAQLGDRGLRGSEDIDSLARAAWRGLHRLESIARPGACGAGARQPLQRLEPSFPERPLHRGRRSAGARAVRGGTGAYRGARFRGAPASASRWSAGRLCGRRGAQARDPAPLVRRVSAQSPHPGHRACRRVQELRVGGRAAPAAARAFRRARSIPQVHSGHPVGLDQLAARVP